MQAFDLQQALSGKPVLLRNGNKAYILKNLNSAKVNEYTLIGYYVLENGLEIGVSWSAAGKYLTDSGSSYDIIGMWQQTITIGKHKIPEPMRTEPPQGTVYYVPLLDTENKFYDWNKWQDSLHDDRALVRGLAHYTHEAAEAHAKALIELSAGSEYVPF